MINRMHTNKYMVRGHRLIAPDQNAKLSYEDIDGPDAGRDEQGYMHRAKVRNKVGSWSFSYAIISEDDYIEMESIFASAGDTFDFTHPSPTNPSTTVTTQCYRSKYSIEWHDINKHQWRNYSFDIIEV